jgi:hypothetical protein
MSTLQTLRVGELCRRLDVPYRQVRYILEENILPLGVDPAPARGNHRQLTAAQAFWLSMVLKLKASCVAAPQAATIADLTQGLFHKTVDTRRYDPDFAPFAGRLRAKLNWYLEIGDLRWFRVLAEQEKPLKRVFSGVWSFWHAAFSVPEGDWTPVVSLRLDLTRLARLLCRE